MLLTSYAVSQSYLGEASKWDRGPEAHQPIAGAQTKNPYPKAP